MEEQHETHKSSTLGKFSDAIVNKLLVSKIGDIFDTGFELSPANALKILILLCIGDIKNCASTVIQYFVYLVRQSPVVALNLLMKMSAYMDRRKPPAQIEDTSEDDGLYNKVEMNIEMNFMIALHEYITKNADKCRFTKDLTGIKIQSTKENVFTRIFKNIEVDMFEDVNKLCTIKIETCIIYELNVDSKEITGVQTNNITERKSGQIVNSYVDLLTPDQQKIVNKIHQHMYDNIKSTDDGLIEYIKSSEKNEVDGFSEIDICEMLCEKYPSMNKKKSFVELEIAICLLFKYLKFASISDSLGTIRKCSRIVFDPHHVYILKRNVVNEFSFANALCDKLSSWAATLGIASTDISAAFGSVLETSKEINKTKSEIFSGLHKLSFGIITTERKDPSIIMEKFISSIYTSYKKCTTRVKIFTLSLEEEVIAKIVENQEYVAWDEKKKIYDGMCNATKSSRDPYDGESLGMMAANLMQHIPSKTIKLETVLKRIVAKKLNDVERGIESLYLREENTKLLRTALDQFKNSKQTLQDLGFQNKLNILLYGEPGTGKSTAIQAVATYLQKDIYYVDLRKAKTNEDLQMIFDYVNINVPNGGIIVIEDIDAMTDVVLERRKETRECTVADLLDSQKNELTLEYFLNVLQGTLTVDNSIFIVTTNHIDHLDPAFYRDGRFDVKINLGLCDHYQFNSIYKTIIGRDVPRELLEKIPENKHAPATVIFHLKSFIFCRDTPDADMLKKLF